jgi:enediyne biosynthesis protein E4
MSRRPYLALLLLVWLTICVSPAHAQDGPNRLVEAFVNVSQEAGITATHRGEWDQFNRNFTSGYLGIGQAWGDYDNDGWLDLYVTGNLDASVLYHNEGDGTFSLSPFSDSVSLQGVKSGGTVWGDYNNDGWLDLYVANDGPDTLFYNQQGAGFLNVTESAGLGDPGKGSSATWGDYNGDSYLDLYVTNWSCYPECGDPTEHDAARDTLYRNNGDGTFADVSSLLVYEKLLGAGFAASFVDYDGDGDVDIYVANDMLKNPIGNVLWRNDGPGCDEWCWTDASVEARANTLTYAMGTAIGDYDGDLDVDFYFTNIVNRMTLLQNQGDGTFVDVARLSRAGIGPTSAVGWGTAFFDYDNDGWLDLYVATTEFIQFDIVTGPQELMAPYPDFLFRNEGDATFSDVTPRSWVLYPESSMGIAYADYDRDGWLDFVVGNWNHNYGLYRNTGGDHHWLTLRLVGGGPVNHDAVGTRVFLTDDGRTQMQDVISGSGLGAGNDLALHFGLGQAGISQIRIVWPDGIESVLENVAPDQILDVYYEEVVQP